MLWKTVALLGGMAIAAAAQAETLDAASRRFDDLQYRQNRAGLERMVAAEFHYLTGTGTREGRKRFLDVATEPVRTLKPFVITERLVVPLGRDAGVVTARAVVRGVGLDGKPFTSRIRFSDVFERRGGRWLVRLVQVTPDTAQRRQ